MKQQISATIFLLLVAYLALAVTTGLVVPPFENLDEVEHFGVVRYVAESGHLPLHGDPAAEHYHYRQEASQPPLYYLLSAGLVRLLGLHADETALAAYRLNPQVACGPQAANLYDNRAVLYHNPNQEAAPWSATLQMLHLLRLESTLLQAVTIVVTYAIARAALPERRRVQVLAAVVVALNPQFLLVASGVNNDNLVTPLAAVALYLLLRSWRAGLSLHRTLLLAFVAGLAGLSKLSGWFLLPLAAGVFLLAWWRGPQRRPSTLIAHLLLLGGPAIALGAPWFWRNWQLYGDPTALQPMLTLVGAQVAPLNPGVELMFKSFWGQLPCSFYPPPFYILYAVLVAAAVAGWAWGWRRLSSQQRWTLAILAGWFVLVVAGWLRWNAMTPATGGRLLFPALPALAVLLAVGLDSLGRPRLVVPLAVGLLALSACWSVVGILPGFFAPPSRYDDPADVQPTHPLAATLGDSIGLLGYDAVLHDDPLALDVTLYWQALAPMSVDYLLTLQLVSPISGDTTLRWNYNSWPGHGNYPTSAWQPGEVIADRYRLYLPPSAHLTQAWDLQLAFFTQETQERLPLRLDGVDAGDRLVLLRQRLPGRLPDCPQEAHVAGQIHFAETIALTHAWVEPAQGGVNVHLCWQDLQPTSIDYTVFVHLYDATNALVVAGDGPPMGGAFPTSTWQPGDVISDAHFLSLSPQAGQTIAIGLYNWEDNVRLPAFLDGSPLPNAAVPVWQDQ